MSLTNYNDLQTQVANWLARQDLNPYIPDMITLFEAFAARKLRVRSMETTATITTTNGVGSLPADYLGYRRVTWTGSPITDLTYVAPSIYQFENPYNAAGIPQLFTIEASSIKVQPVDDTGGISMLYYQKTTALSSALNWLMTNHPDAYLFGVLCEANAFKRGNSGFQEAALWKARRDEVFGEIEMAEFRERGSMSMRVIGQTP
jgi:hypothetical protein